MTWLSEPAVLSTVIGLGGGMLLGLAARLGRFCTLGAIEDFLYGNNSARLRMWGVALGIGILASFAAMAAGVFEPAATFHLQRGWNPLASVVGGLVFGYGMALAGNCGFGALARMGGGDLRALVIVLVLGLVAYMTISGPLAAPRVALFPDWDLGFTPGLAHGVNGATGLPVPAAGLALGALLLAATLQGARRAGMTAAQAGWGALVGLTIAASWIGTYRLAEATFGETPVLSHSFSGPIGETILYMMISSGVAPNFAVGSVLGVAAGAFLGAALRGHIRWEACEDARELRRQLLGAALMGWGAVVAAGCSIGQGLSAFSVLALSGPVTLLAIFLGATLGLRQLIAGLEPL